MTGAMNLLAALTWDPGIRGFLTVVLSVLILYGSVALIVSTNSGPRLGTLISVCALFGWFTVMGIVWSAYGIGWKGQAPTWEVKNIVAGAPTQSAIEEARTLPLPDDGTLPKADELRRSDPELLAEFPLDKKTPNLGDFIPLKPELEKQFDSKLGDWHLYSVSNRYTGELQSAAMVAVGPDGHGIYKTASDFTVLDAFWTGGNTPRTDDSTIGRVIYRVKQPFDVFHPPFLAAVQVQAVIPQATKPGQAPPSPVRDEKAPVYTVIFERNRGNLRQPAMMFTLFSGIVFGVTANMLHRRDKLAQVQRAAVAGAA